MTFIKYKDYLIKEADEVNKPAKVEKKVKLPEQVIILSDKFRRVLDDVQKIKTSNIAKRLLELETSPDKLFDLSYVDVDDDGENVTYLQGNRIDRLKKEGKPIEEFWTTKMRTQQKINRFIGSVLPKFSEDSVTKFVKKLKSIVKEADEADNFELVEGDDIVYWYNSKNYDTDAGTMGSSCMSYSECGQYLNCYRKNPAQCKMLILKNKDGDKIRGRALVWKLSKPKDVIFMDRVYTNVDDEEMLFTNYAKKEGWYYKSEQVYGEADIVVPGKGAQNIKLEVILDDCNYDMYPYVDTLRYFYEDEKMMASHDDGPCRYITLTDTSGHYEEWYEDSDDEDYVDPMVHDGYNNEEIPESRATWCKYDNGYIRTTQAIRLAGGEAYAYPNSPHIVWSELPYTKKWYAKEDCEYSKVLNTWVWKKFVVKVYHDKDKKQEPDITHRFELNKTIGKVSEDYFDLDLLYVIDSKKVPGKQPGKVKTEYTYGFKEDQGKPPLEENKPQENAEI